MPHQFIHFAPRKLVVSTRLPTAATRPFYQERELQTDLDALWRPQFHVTRSATGPATRVRAGDTIWIIGQLKTPWGSLPPSLDARIELVEEPILIQADERTEGVSSSARLRFKAAKSSRWLPLADATKALVGLQTQTAKGAISPLFQGGSIGQSLQSMRQLLSDGPLREQEAWLERQGFDFVSYRLKDGTHQAFEKVRALVKGGQPVFWDRWSLPRRLVERREYLPLPALDDYIEEQIKKANVVWDIATPLYGAPGSYSERERSIGLRHSKLSSPSAPIAG
jgi:hypothetical protein